MIRDLQRFYFTKGDTYIEQWFITDDDDVPYDLSIYDNIIMDIRYGISNESRLLYSLSLENGAITINGDDNNIIIFRIEKEYTKDFATGIFFRDIKFIKGDDVKTLLKGKIEIRKNIS